MLTTTDVTRVSNWLREQKEAAFPLLVSIDGLPASGKSTLAKTLAQHLGARHVPVDDFLVRQQGTYIPSLRVEVLRNHVRDALTKSSMVIVDGVCVNRVMDVIEIPARARVYVMRLDVRNEWFEGEMFTTGLSLDEAIAEETAIAGGELPGLWAEVIEYHFHHQPHANADVIFQHKDDE